MIPHLVCFLPAGVAWTLLAVRYLVLCLAQRHAPRPSRFGRLVLFRFLGVGRIELPLRARDGAKVFIGRSCPVIVARARGIIVRSHAAPGY